VGRTWPTTPGGCRGRATCGSPTSGAAERAGLIRANFKVRAGNNAVRAGIGPVSARLREGTVRVVEGTCPNLLAEAALYRYGEARGDSESEAPQDEHNHALDALRYLVMGLDAHRLARPRAEPRSPESPPSPPRPAPRPWLHWTNDALYDWNWRPGDR
jgi:hypothetical protein